MKLDEAKIAEAEARRPPQWEIPCSDGSHPTFWKTVVESPQWLAWENEVARRFHVMVTENVDVLGVFDVDECRECGYISPKHFQDFLRFTVKKENLP